MVRQKIEHGQESEIIYSKEHWNLLTELRKRALMVTSIFANNGFETLTYGSISRGDVKPTSDIDIILKTQISSYRVELMLDQISIPVIGKRIIQATPNDIIKANYELEGEICLSILLTDFTTTPFEFYKFGGALTHEELVNNLRVPGIDKRLILIEPTKLGHLEHSVVDNPQLPVKMMNISQSMVDQRVRVLSRRDKIGRTGVFLNKELQITDNIEEELRKLARKNSLIRRRLSI